MVELGNRVLEAVYRRTIIEVRKIGLVLRAFLGPLLPLCVLQILCLERKCYDFDEKVVENGKTSKE